MTVNIYDLDLISPSVLKAIIHDERMDIPVVDIRNKNNRRAAMRCYSYFQRGTPDTPCVIYDMVDGEIIGTKYKNIKDHPKIRAKLGRPMKEAS